MTGDLLRGRTALVTGGSRGIGRAIARALSGAGASVAVLSRAGIDGAVACDLRDERQIANAVAKVRGLLGPVAILVNCAGVLPRGPLEAMSNADIHETLQVNSIAPAILCRELTADLCGCGRGRVINVASIFSVVGYPDRVVYASSKGALLQLTRALAIEWARHKVTVNAILPGVIDTELTAPLMADAERRSEVLSSIPLGRFGQPRDIAPLSVFLAGDQASYITGAAIPVDGGWTAR